MLEKLIGNCRVTRRLGSGGRGDVSTLALDGRNDNGFAFHDRDEPAA